jgi:hypothetical protein
MSCLSAYAQTAVTADLDTTSIRIGEQAKIVLEVSYSGKAPEVLWPEVKDTLQRNIEVIDAGVIDTFHVGSNSRQVREIIITSWDSGFWAIPPFYFTVNGEKMETEAYLFSVNTVAVESDEAPKDIKPIMEEPFSLKDWLILNWIYIAIALGAIALLFALIKLKSRPATEVVKPAPAVRPAHELALERLTSMKSQEQWKVGTSKKYFVEVTDALRIYLEGRYNIPALEQTTAEITEQLKYTVIDDNLKNALASILMRADMAKFAKEESSEATRKQALEQAIELVQKTKSVTPEKTDEH